MIHAVHAVPSLHPRGGGPSRSVVKLTDYLATEPSIRISLVTQGRPGEPEIASTHGQVDRLVGRSSSAWLLRAGQPQRAVLQALLNSDRMDLLHVHALWHAGSHWASTAARQNGIPLLIQPRGMLEPWALNHKAWKKRLGMALYQGRDLLEARVLVATADAEYLNLRQLGFRQPVAVIPNGVEMPQGVDSATWPDKPVRTALFLSRIQGKKGLPNLIHAWSIIKPAGWRLQIAGPDEDGHLAEVLRLVQEQGLSGTVEYLGEIDGPDKSAAYRGADLFVLPTYSENFGLVVAEALAHGLPVITTQGAPWADLPAFGCGWWIPIGVEPLAKALQEALALSDAERAAMGELGLAYVRRYDWAAIAEDMAEVYRWVLGQGDRPACVRVD